MSQESLARYFDKRDFNVTSEPKGGKRSAGGQRLYVIQKHAASRLHYDFRLELDGTLKSWAVPKGPSLDPSVKRMAVHVEDHPIDYGGFEGTIPKGQYGAGSVIVWDTGTWEPVGDAAAGYRAGKLKFRIAGQKLQGQWTLVRMHGRANERQEPWLLIKERDDEARAKADYSVVDALPASVLSGRTIDAKGQLATATPAEAARDASRPAAAPAKKAKVAQKSPPAGRPSLPETFAPQLATLVSTVPEDDGWIYEIKFDGYRLLARVDGSDVRLVTRNGNDWTERMPGLAKAVAAWNLGSAWVDGEIVVFGADGAPDFNRLQKAFDVSRTESIQYCVFDLPFHAGRDLRALPLVERRAALERLLDGAPPAVRERIRFSQAFDAKASELLQSACRMKLEGVIGKRADAPYVSKRHPSWIKLKCTARQEFVVAGWTDPQGARTGIGSLLLGIHDEAGALRFAGAVGSGFDTDTLSMLRQRLDALAADRHPFAERPKGVRGHWVKPELVAEVSFGEWTPDRKIRHAVFHALRSDKPPAAITQEIAVPPAKTKPKTKATGKPKDGAVEVEGVRVTHPERVVDRSSGLTKLDVVNHYIRVARTMLPHLDDRPVSLVRAPAGLDGQLFFQRHAETLKIPELKRLDPAISPDHKPMVEVDSFNALVGAAQQNVIEFHTWNATTRSPGKPDRIVFDLDPGEGVAWKAMQEAASLVHALLDEMKLASFLKTSGGKGLHVVVPIAPKEDWDPVKALAQRVVEHLAEVLPDRFVAKSGPKNRVGRIFVDYLRNGFGATTAAAWSARARPGLGVSVPCAWDELASLASGAHWTIADVAERLEEKIDPWKDYAKASRQTLAAATKALTKK